MRVAFKMKLKPGCEVEYQRRHASLWPELRDLLVQSGIRNYSIFHDPDTNILFAIQELVGEQNSQDLGTHDVVKRWWDYMADIMETNSDNSPTSVPLNNVFHLD